MTRNRKLLVALAASAASVIGLGGPAFADHSHFVVITHPRTGVTTCQYLAAGGSEAAAVHPLHNKVHMGTPGSDERGNDVDKDANETRRCDVVRRK
jgi:hypothetical protein